MAGNPSRARVAKAARGFGIKKLVYKPKYENTKTGGTYFGYTQQIPESLVGYHVPSVGEFAFVFTKETQRVMQNCAVSTSHLFVSEHRKLLTQRFGAFLQKTYPSAQIETNQYNPSSIFIVSTNKGRLVYEITVGGLSKQLIMRRS